MMKDLGARTMVLVEGQRDCLRLLTLGIPAMCIFGTQSWSKSKAKLLEVSGVRRIVLLMDGDEAGINATEKIEASCAGMFKTVTMKLWDMENSPYREFLEHENPTKAAKEAGVELWDPMNCPVEVLEKLKDRYF
jgi:DNA primase